MQNRGAEVIKPRGASSAASAANAAIVGVYNLTHDTPAGEYYSVGRCSHGEYGVDPGLIFSFPSRTENGVSRIVEGLEHDEFGRMQDRGYAGGTAQRTRRGQRTRADPG